MSGSGVPCVFSIRHQRKELKGIGEGGSTYNYVPGKGAIAADRLKRRLTRQNFYQKEFILHLKAHGIYNRSPCKNGNIHRNFRTVRRRDQYEIGRASCRERVQILEVEGA